MKAALDGWVPACGSAECQFIRRFERGAADAADDGGAVAAGKRIVRRAAHRWDTRALPARGPARLGDFVSGMWIQRSSAGYASSSGSDRTLCSENLRKEP